MVKVGSDLSCMHLKQQSTPQPAYLLNFLLLLGLALTCFQCRNSSSVWLYVDNQNDAAVSVVVGEATLKEIPSGGHLITMVRPGRQKIYMKIGTTGALDSISINLEEDTKYVLNPFRATTYYLGEVEYAKYSNPSGHSSTEEEVINQMIFPVKVDYLLESPPAIVEVSGNSAFARRKYLRRASDPNPNGPSLEELAAFRELNKGLFSKESSTSTISDASIGNDQENSADTSAPASSVITGKQQKLLRLIAEAKLEEALLLHFGKSATVDRHKETLKAAETAYRAEPLKNYEAYSIASSKVSLEILKSVNGITPGTYDESLCLSLLADNKIEEATKLLIDAGHEMGAHQRLRYTQWRNEIDAGRITEASTLHVRNRIREAIKGSIESGWLEY